MNRGQVMGIQALVMRKKWKNHLLACCCFLAANIAFGQGGGGNKAWVEVEIPKLPQTGAGFEDFVPENWRIEESQCGDLGGDGSVTDCFLLLKASDGQAIIHDDEKYPVPLDTNPRMLAILLAQQGRYTLAGQNSILIPRLEQEPASDPIDGISGGGISISNQHAVVDLGFWGGAIVRYHFAFTQIKNAEKSSQDDFYLVDWQYDSIGRRNLLNSTIHVDYIKRETRYTKECYGEDEDCFDEDDDKEEALREKIEPFSDALKEMPLLRFGEVDLDGGYDFAVGRVTGKNR